MSGIEVITGLVAGIVSAFSGATSLIQTWRKDRKEKEEEEEAGRRGGKRSCTGALFVHWRPNSAARVRLWLFSTRGEICRRRWYVLNIIVLPIHEYPS